MKKEFIEERVKEIEELRKSLLETIPTEEDDTYGVP